tara:strand:+ start:52 stop:201 length:150 start_codon:yes stop_codon:yes gene_type:complete
MSKDLLDAMFAGNTKKAQQIFKRDMSDKQDEALDVKRVAVTAEVFKTKD